MEDNDVNLRHIQIQADLDLDFSDNIYCLNISKIKSIKSRYNSRNNILIPEKISRLGKILHDAKLHKKGSTPYNKLFVIDSVLPLAKKLKSISPNKIEFLQKPELPKCLKPNKSQKSSQKKEKPKGPEMPKQRNFSYYRIRNYFLSDLN
jgi:hypothetical protein